VNTSEKLISVDGNDKLKKRNREGQSEAGKLAKEKKLDRRER